MIGQKQCLLWGAMIAALATPAMRADFITIAQPTSSYTSGTTLLDFTDSDYTLISSLSGGGETLTYDTPIDERTVPTSWNTWGTPPAVETATPRVGTTDGVSTLTISLSKAASTFGLEIIPDNFAAENITAAFYAGAQLVGTVSLSPNGNGAALLYAASTTTNPFTRIAINNTTGDDFAIARQRFIISSITVPEPASYALIGSALLLGLAAFRWRASRQAQ